MFAWSRLRKPQGTFAMIAPTTTASRHLTWQWHGMVAVVHLRHARLTDPLDIAEIRDELCQFVQAAGPRQLLVNFGAVRQCSSEMIIVLLEVRKLMQRSRARLKLCGLNHALRELFRILNLDGTVFDIHDSATDALWHWAAGA
jgi:anti-anti-sigma regulatory factor